VRLFCRYGLHLRIPATAPPALVPGSQIIVSPHGTGLRFVAYLPVANGQDAQLIETSGDFASPPATAHIVSLGAVKARTYQDSIEGTVLQWRQSNVSLQLSGDFSLAQLEVVARQLQPAR
jgi:hypothetical protein